MKNSDIGICGLGVMGKNLALNLEEKGNTVSVYNRTAEGEELLLSDFMSSHGTGKAFKGFDSIPEFVASLGKPRKILIMVKAGSPVDSVIAELFPHLDPGDILIDGGNSNFNDTERRRTELAEKKIDFVGMGISGGEEGARYGPSLMPGTTPKTWAKLKDIFEPIAARSFTGNPCASLTGSGGAGHFVKMVHNGIEYADMQLIAEAYHLMMNVAGMSHNEMAARFRLWNEEALSSYLIEITADILTRLDGDGEPLVEKILDSAGQKGTGKWTAITALEAGLPGPVITESVVARFISAQKELRVGLRGDRDRKPDFKPSDRKRFIDDLGDALLASRMMVHAEGFFMITEMSEERNWNINPSLVAESWQGGCIIRSELLKSIVSAFENGQGIRHLMESPLYMNRFRPVEAGWRQMVAHAASSAVPAPAMMSALAEYDSLRSPRLPANLIQAQRDYFGAHKYERTDQPRGTLFHTRWNEDNE